MLKKSKAYKSKRVPSHDLKKVPKPYNEVGTKKVKRMYDGSGTGGE